jgi:translation elongation factor EF-1beta
MGKTIVIYKIKPVDFEKIDETIEQIKSLKNGEVKDIQKEPIGFGVEIVKAAILIEEKKEGALDALTSEITSLSSVEEAEVDGMTLL